MGGGRANAGIRRILAINVHCADPLLHVVVVHLVSLELWLVQLVLDPVLLSARWFGASRNQYSRMPNTKIDTLSRLTSLELQRPHRKLLCLSGYYRAGEIVRSLVE